MKKFSWIFALILALSLVFVFAGCGEEPANPGTYDGSGPQVIYEMAVDGLPGILKPAGVLTNNDIGDYFERSGNPKIRIELDGSVTVYDIPSNEDWGALTIKKEFFDFIGAVPPVDITFYGVAAKAGTLKIDPAGGSTSGENGVTVVPLDGTNKKKAVSGGVEFEITGTVLAGSLLAGQYTAGVRLQSENGPVGHTITNIIIVQK